MAIDRTYYTELRDAFAAANREFVWLSRRLATVSEAPFDSRDMHTAATLARNAAARATEIATLADELHRIHAGLQSGFDFSS